MEQAKRAIFRDLIQDWREAVNLPLSLRKELNEKFPIEISAKTFVSENENAVKALLVLRDGFGVETVLMRHKDKRNTVCVSSQIGCSLNCSFCATAKMGFKRNLEAWEIVQQALFFFRYLKQSEERVTNVVFMGMGEPFLNYENVMGAIKTLNDKEGFNLGARRLSVSTVGIIEGIEKLSKEKLQINLAISLHAPDDELRSKIIPINKKYPIGKILNATDNYVSNTRRRVMFEYIMISGLNDSKEQAKKLAGLMKKPLYFVNLISYNPTGAFQPSSSLRIREFKEILEKEGVVVTQRYRFGKNIKGACGQLLVED